MTTSQAVAANGGCSADASIVIGWCGPGDHGIARFARQTASAATALGFGGAVLPELHADRLIELVDRLPATARLLHLQLSDWLFADAGVDVDQAIAELSDRLRRRGVALALTLHDLPQVSDGPALYLRRCNSYRLMVGSASGVVVSSEHERLLLQEALGPALAVGPSAPGQDPVGTPLDVIPLPIDPLVPSRPTPTRLMVDPSHRAGPGDPALPTIGIFGYLYPGKGHREVIEEVSGMHPGPAVVAVGRTSNRHAGLLDELVEAADRCGVVFRCTGYLPDAELPDRLRDVTVPVAPHTHISASGSINSWLAVGRRPLVPAGRYVDELDRRMPGSVWMYEPGELRRHLERAIAHPELTWLSEDLLVGPSTPMVAGRYLEWLRSRAALVDT